VKSQLKSLATTNESAELVQKSIGHLKHQYAALYADNLQLAQINQVKFGF